MQLSHNTLYFLIVKVVEWLDIFGVYILKQTILATGNKQITSQIFVFFLEVFFFTLMQWWNSLSFICYTSTFSSLSLQLCFAPCFLAAFFCVSGAVNGLTVEENVSKLKRVSISFHAFPLIPVLRAGVYIGSLKRQNKGFFDWKGLDECPINFLEILWSPLMWAGCFLRWMSSPAWPPALAPHFYY